MRSLLAALILLLAPAAFASNCPGYTYTLTNGQTADANQVQANFNTILNCANTLVVPSTLANYAPLNSPAFTGTPTAPTQTTGDNSTALATDAFVQNSLVNNGLQSSGQIVISSSLTLNSSQAGHNLLISGTGTTITFPSTATTFWLSNIGTFNVTLSFPNSTDFRTTLYPGEQVGLAGDGTGFWRIVAEGNPLYTVTQGQHDNSTHIATTAYVDAAAPHSESEVACTPSTCVDATGFGVSSVTYNGVGNYTVTFTVPFSTANYSLAVSGNTQQVWALAQNTNTIIVMMANATGTPVDGKFYLITYGS